MFKTSSAMLVLLLFPLAGALQANSIVVVQPVQICLNDGTSCAALTYDSANVQSFWSAQAGLTIDLRTPRTFDSTAYQTMDTNSDAVSFLTANPSPDPSGPSNLTSSPITVWFSLAGFTTPFDYAIVGSNRSWINSNLTSSLETFLLARAIGTNLGLPDITSTDSTDLMISTYSPNSANLTNFHLNSSQATAAQSSSFVQLGTGGFFGGPPPGTVPTPEPPTFGCILLGLGLLLIMEHRRMRAPRQ